MRLKMRKRLLSPRGQGLTLREDQSSVLMALLILEEEAAKVKVERDGYSASEVARVLVTEKQPLTSERCKELLAELMGANLIADASPDDYSLYSLEDETRQALLKAVGIVRDTRQGVCRDIRDSVEKLSF